MIAGKYTIVAQVIDGMDVLDKMEKIKVGKLDCHHYGAFWPLSHFV